MASLQGHGNNQNNDEDTTVIHVIDIVDGSFTGKSSKLRIECDNIVEFKINGKEEYDIIQVFKDGNDYYPVNHGYKLLNLKNRTLPKQRRLLFSYDLNQPELELYFCVIPTSQRDSIARARKYPRIHCEKNCLKLYQNDIKFHLTDEKQSQKVYMHQTDTIQIEWISQIPYRIEEKKYCPVSGGLYTVEATSAKKSNRFSTKGSFMKTFNELGMSFLIRYTETNEIHDVIICIVNEKYKMKHIEITDESIQPNVLWIEKADWLVFDWNTKRKQTVIQIEPFTVDKNSKQSIELKTPGKHFSWPNDATRRGYMVHQFNETGVFCFKTANNQIGTIVVEARQTIHQVPIFHEQLVHKMNTNSLVEFNWTMDPTDEKTILFTLDTYSSVPTQAVEGAQGVFNCASHKCLRADPIFQRYLYTCETLLLNIPQHGLYNFVYSEDQNTPLISIIVENDIDKHTVVYNENDVFEPATLIINRNDQVWFEPSLSVKVETIYETNQFGDELVPDRPIFRPQEKSVNFFMKSFPDMGIYYFSMDKTDKDSDEKTHPLAIIVLSDVRFHYKTVGNDHFDNQAIITNVNDFIIWEFEQIISHNVAYVQPNDTLQDLISCHERAVQGRNRQCLAVECTQSGTFFFANPEFERVTGSVEDRLIATVIVEPQYSQHTVMVDRRGFIPDVLNIAEKETVSWILANPAQNDRIYIRSADNDDDEIVQNELVHRDITKFVHNVHHLHTFHKSGEYIIRSNRFQTIANVFVYSEDMIKSQKKRVPPPQFNEDIDTLSSKGARVHLTCPNRYANIFYTLDGKTPTQHSSNTYDDDEGVILNEEGLHVIRAYATEKQKVSSSIVTSSPTFVMDSRELPQVTPEPIPREEEVLHGVQNTRAPPSSYQVMLSLALENPNKVYGNIEIEPASYIDNIDYFELYIDNVPQREHIASDDPHFSASGFAGGEQYQVYVVAHPKANVPDRKQITSNNRAFEIKRETQGGAPLISLGVSKEQNELVLMWAHIKDPVSEYNVYVNGTRTHTLHKENFDEAYRIHFQDVEQDRKYAIYVEAKMQRNNEIRKSNVISVTSPLPMTVNETMIKENFPYIIIKNEQKVDDSHAEKEDLESLLHDDSKHRAKLLLKKLSEAIEDRSKRFNYTYPHSETLSYNHLEHFSQQQSSSDPYTVELPPKSQRRSSNYNKTAREHEL
ncbi:hypothetical protein I4U23_021368 [Adineta vaga]|nr:hypothetical protein I4U23_021368 [Adineta vaga]